MVSVPGVLFAVSPLARFQNSFTKARAQVSRRSGSFCRRVYFVIDSPVVG